MHHGLTGWSSKTAFEFAAQIKATNFRCASASASMYRAVVPRFRMTSKLLHISKAPANLADLPGRTGDESSSAGWLEQPTMLKSAYNL